MIIHQTTLSVVHGSVTEQDVDAIVNAANTTMRGGGGIDGRIHAAAGPELLEELRRIAPGGAQTGTAVITAGHRLKQKHIIHTPGPVWHGGKSHEREDLASCYRQCLLLAHQHQLSSIAFCSISTGVYRFPLDQAAPLAIETAVGFLRGNPDTLLRRVVFAMYGLEEFQEFSRAAEAFRPITKDQADR